MAESTRSANWSRSRDPNRENSAEVSVGAGTPASTAAIAVHRPSPESETRPENSARPGERTRAVAARSSSQDWMTLPRRQTSATSSTASS
ncbi:hypothetical protein [Petropleomorpha daqingensis]|uniref:Uncharacterized protein n=1 Tax=Petropleomorpha daqingensis TaxID=2026353 RepID=A0A853CLC9_9ACTN|nr:hypothetical protein [Petropleomorpha daqingensis]NYJ08216.1 hypothetical protein [Petropleomorpha daqingensis]